LYGKRWEFAILPGGRGGEPQEIGPKRAEIGVLTKAVNI
jgi:hypothetical protein